MTQYLAPGVYIEEVDLGPVPIQGVATSTGGIIGLCQRGPVNVPTLITSSGQFTATFGGPIPWNANAGTPLAGNINGVAYGVQGFFQNGGTMLYVIRVAPSTATDFSVQYALGNPNSIDLTLQANDPGSWGNPVFGVLNGRYQQTDGLAFTFGSASNLPYTVGTGSTVSVVNVSSTVGLYIGAVVSWNPTPATPATAEYGVVTALTATSFTLGHVAFTAAPTQGAIVTLVEFSLGITLYQAGAVVQTETWPRLNVNSATPNYIGTIVGAIGGAAGGSNLILAGLSSAPDFTTVAAYGPAAGAAPVAAFTAGADGISGLTVATYNALFNDPSLDTDEPATRGGIYAFQNIRGMMMISMPGNTDPGVQADLIALCENDKYKIAYLDPGPTTDLGDWHLMDASLNDIITQRGNYDSEYAALYYPWVCLEDPTPPNPNNVGYVYLSPSGFQMGITARVDINRGVYKAPANEIVQSAVAFSHVVDQGAQDVLNPLGINCFRDFRAENYGLRIWGARTVSSNGQWKYVNIRRLFQYIEASIEYGTQWVVFEPNNAVTWARVRQSVSDFLTDTWRSGALQGSKPSEAFYVLCDVPDTMTESDLENGRLICEIGIAPTFPAEFVIFQISQWTGPASGS
ncbi:MAG: phage tail sheath C-terminal domain-containing protein [Candidatus Lustribacter sp.]|jgi:phage tail sheath protein FI